MGRDAEIGTAFFPQAFPQALQRRAPPACCLSKYWTEAPWSEAKPEEGCVSLLLRSSACKSVLLHLPYIYFEFGVILRHIFLDQAVRSFFRLTEAGESQRQDIFQLDLLLCSWSWSAFLKYTYFYASVRPKTLGFLNQQHIGGEKCSWRWPQIWKIKFCKAALLINNLKSLAA